MDTEIKDERKSVSFKEDPAGYIRQCVEESMRRNQELNDINVENQQFYEGIDPILEERKANKRVKRAAIFINETKPGIDTRVADVLSKVDELDNPAVFSSKLRDAPEEVVDKIAAIEDKINQQMRDAGYLSGGFREHITGAELYRTPSCVKVGWEPTFEKEAVITGQNDELGKPEVSYQIVEGGRPFVEWLEPTRFLYEPNVSSYYKDSVYTLDAQYMSYDELLASAHRLDWDVDLIERNKDRLLGAGVVDENTVREEVEDEKGTGFDFAYKDGKIFVVEAYVIQHDEDGRPVTHRTVMVADEYIVKNEKEPNELIDFPFVPITANRMPGTIEAMSSVDIIKPLQRLYNEAFNVWLDSMTYRAFPPMKAPSNLTFKHGQPVWEPMAIWYMSDPEAFQPIINNPGSAPDMVAIMNAVGANIRNVLSASDLQEGFNANAYEKATSSKLRFMSSAKRSVPTHKDYGRALVKVAELMLKFNQQFATNKEDYIVPGGIVIDAPSLTNINDPEQDKQESMFLYSSALQNPLYQTNTGSLYLLSLWREVVRSMRPNTYQQFVPSDEEMKKQLMAKVEAEMAASEKLSSVEQMQMAGGHAPQLQGDGNE